MKTIRVGSRDSMLAVAQAKLVMGAIQSRYPALRLELVTMKTRGDKLLETPIEQLGGKGVFITELTRAMQRGDLDLCVHSLKDMPAEDDPALPIVAVGPREDPRDVLVLPAGAVQPDKNLPIGCSSNRRCAQLAGLFPGWRVEPVRGNVQTRLRKLDEGRYGALVLAAAGLRRLGLEGRIHTLFSVEEMPPACGQGIVAVQGLAGVEYPYLDAFHSKDSQDMARCERAFARRVGGGCTALMAVHASVCGEVLTVQGMLGGVDNQLHELVLEGPRKSAESLGEELARQLCNQAGKGPAGGSGNESQ